MDELLSDPQRLLVPAALYGVGRFATVKIAMDDDPKIPSNAVRIGLDLGGIVAGMLIAGSLLPNQNPMIIMAAMGAVSAYVYDCDGNFLL